MIDADKRSPQLARYYATGRGGRDFQSFACSRCADPVPNGQTKYCQRCRKQVDLERGRSEHTAQLRKARYASAAEHERYMRRRDAARAAHAEWKRRNPDSVNASAKTRNAAKRANGGRVSPQEWNDLRDSYLSKCVYCGKQATTMDHIVPIAAGGKHELDNLAPACKSCNSSKGTRPLLYFLYVRNFRISQKAAPSGQR